MWNIIVGLPIYYLICCWLRWRIAKHYEPHFRFMDWEDFIEAWESIPMGGNGFLYRSIVAGVPILLVTMGLLRIFGVL